MSNVTMKQLDKAVTLAHSEGRITLWTELMDVRNYLTGMGDKQLEPPRDPREIMAEAGYKIS